jgi:hypothetical protein
VFAPRQQTAQRAEYDPQTVLPSHRAVGRPLSTRLPLFGRSLEGKIRSRMMASLGFKTLIPALRE